MKNKLKSIVALVATALFLGTVYVQSQTGTGAYGRKQWDYRNDEVLLGDTVLNGTAPATQRAGSISVTGSSVVISLTGSTGLVIKSGTVTTY